MSEITVVDCHHHWLKRPTMSSCVGLGLRSYDFDYHGEIWAWLAGSSSLWLAGSGWPSWKTPQCLGKPSKVKSCLHLVFVLSSSCLVFVLSSSRLVLSCLRLVFVSSGLCLVLSSSLPLSLFCLRLSLSCLCLRLHLASCSFRARVLLLVK